ncbi:MAG: hypothetical protein AAGD04_10455 [Pseudomonadota bacterium]
MVQFLKDLADNTKDAVSTGAKKSGNWLSGPFKTDALMAGLEEARIELSLANEALSAEEVERDTVIMDLRSMGAKAIVLGGLATEIAVFAPPPPTPEELEHLERSEEIYDPLEIAYLTTGSLFLVTLLPRIGAGVIKMITLGKFFKDASKSRFLLGVAKLGKATVVLTAVIFLVETIIKMIHAQKLNDEIEASRKKLKTEISKANREVARVSMEREEATALRTQMLEEAGVENVRAFLISMNEAIADVSADVAFVKVARNLLRIGQAPEMVEHIVQLEPDVIRRIARRLKIEEALIAGQAREEIAENQGIDAKEVDLVARILRVRGDAARGFSDAALVEHHMVSDALADMQIDLATTELAKHWNSLLTAPRLDEIAKDTLIPEEALVSLVAELKAHAQLWQGAELETVRAQNPQVPSNRLGAMSEALEANKAFAKATSMSPDDTAVHLRLPLSALA